MDLVEAHEEAHEVYRAIRASRHASLADELVAAAVRYARIRVDWMMADAHARREMDEARTRAHNAFIECCDILSRAMAKAGEGNRWRERIGDDRKSIGDFACHLHCLLGILAR